jgi:3-phenylpropionate/trans-cinnamate dioxygenase ferredoxin reductase subunit
MWGAPVPVPAPAVEPATVIDRLVIVGAGECGARAAGALRERGFSGSVTLVGEETHAPYERPPLSKAVLSGDSEPAPTTISSADHLRELEIDFLSGVVADTIDRQGHEVGLADGRRLRYDRLLLATGAFARPLPLPGGELAVTLRTFADAVRLRARLVPDARVVVIGGGFIGLEVAASAGQRGCSVTVVELAERVMGRIVPAVVADVLARRHCASGVDLRCGASVDHLEEGPGGLRAVLADGAVLDCDVIIAGVGAAPNVRLAAAAGLSIENGILVDEQLRTSDPSIYAAGDCCSFPHPAYGGRRIRLEAWRNAQDQANLAAANLMGARESYAVIPWFWSDQYELGLQIAGLPDSATVEVIRTRPDGSVVHFGLDGTGRLVSASGVAPGTGIAKDIRLAEMLITDGASPSPEQLGDPAVPLRSLLRQH